MTRLERYERRTSLPLTVGAALFLVVYAVPVVWTQAGSAVAALCAGVNVALWALFAGDLATRAALSGTPVRYLRHHRLDVMIVVVPMFRPLRLLLVLTATRRLFRRGGLADGVRAVVLTTVVVLLVAAVAELDAERGAPGANITTFGDALWWAVATVTTAGYGDVYPVTLAGRVVATALMLVGISLVGVMTAAVAAWFVRQEGAAEGAAAGPR